MPSRCSGLAGTLRCSDSSVETVCMLMQLRKLALAGFLSCKRDFVLHRDVLQSPTL